VNKKRKNQSQATLEEKREKRALLQQINQCKRIQEDLVHRTQEDLEIKHQQQNLNLQNKQRTIIILTYLWLKKSQLNQGL
jgi:hypothetical protein